jgi:hypothetical protein
VAPPFGTGFPVNPHPLVMAWILEGDGPTTRPATAAPPQRPPASALTQSTSAAAGHPSRRSSSQAWQEARPRHTCMDGRVGRLWFPEAGEGGGGGREDLTLPAGCRAAAVRLALPEHRAPERRRGRFRRRGGRGGEGESRYGEGGRR